MNNTTETQLSFAGMTKTLFLKLGVLPFFLGFALVVFSLLSDKFLSGQNLLNVARQSVYLVLVAMGQMLALITGGFDLSVGTVIALTSVVSALTMTWVLSVSPELVWLAIIAGVLAGLFVALLVGALNGLGIAYAGVSPFIMTLGVSSVIAGVALMLIGGVPVSGLPYAFADTFGFGRWLGVPVPVLIALVCVLALWLLMSKTRTGAWLYAVGANRKAAHLSGIDTKKMLLLAYIICSLVAALAGLLITARVESGEANLGASVALESIAACVIAGVSLQGGFGRIQSVVLGAFFIVLVQNGMNLLQLSSYLQMVLLGGMLIMAVVFDQIRYRALMGPSQV